MTDERGEKALRAAADALMEYFDTVQIFVTKDKSEDETTGQTFGKGNLFARLGQISLWLSKVESNIINENGESDEEP